MARLPPAKFLENLLEEPKKKNPNSDLDLSTLAELLKLICRNNSSASVEKINKVIDTLGEKK